MSEVVDTDPRNKIAILYQEMQNILYGLNSERAGRVLYKLNELIEVTNELHTDQEVLVGAYENLHIIGDNIFPSDRWFDEHHTDDIEDWWGKKVDTTLGLAQSVITCIDGVKTGKIDPFPHNPFIEEDESDDE